MRACLAFLVLLLAGPVSAQDQGEPIRQELPPIVDPQLGLAALGFYVPGPEGDVILGDLSYTVRIAFVYDRDARGTKTDLALWNDAIAVIDSYNLAYTRSKTATDPAITFVVAGVATAYHFTWSGTGDAGDSAAYSWIVQHTSVAGRFYYAWLETIGADQVQFITVKGTNCGLGSLNAFNKSSATSWTRTACYKPAQYSSFHECLHNWGCHHRRADGAVNSVHPEGYGWTDGASHRSIMAYKSGTRRQVSNPNVPFIGTTTPSGTPTDNNVAVMVRRAPFMEAMRGAPAASIPAPAAPGKPTFVM